VQARGTRWRRNHSDPDRRHRRSGIRAHRRVVVPTSWPVCAPGWSLWCCWRSWPSSFWS